MTIIFQFFLLRRQKPYQALAVSKGLMVESGAGIC